MWAKFSNFPIFQIWYKKHKKLLSKQFLFVSRYNWVRKYCQKLIFIEIQDGHQNAAVEANETKFKVIWWKLHCQLFSFDEESYNVPQTYVHENPRWPPYIWTPWDTFWSWYSQNSLTRHYNDYKNVGYLEKYIHGVHAMGTLSPD